MHFLTFYNCSNKIYPIALIYNFLLKFMDFYSLHKSLYPTHVKNSGSDNKNNLIYDIFVNVLYIKYLKINYSQQKNKIKIKNILNFLHYNSHII